MSVVLFWKHFHYNSLFQWRSNKIKTYFGYPIMKGIRISKTSLHTYFWTISVHHISQYCPKLHKKLTVVKSEGNPQALNATYEGGEMESFGDSEVLISHVFNHILQLLVGVTTSETGGANSTLEFSPFLLQLTEEEPREKTSWDNQNKVRHFILRFRLFYTRCLILITVRMSK